MEFSRSKQESILSRLTEIIKANLSNEYFGVSELAREIGMSRSNLHRKVKAETGKSLSLFIRHLRLEEASRLLRQTSLTASEVAFKCGFHSVSYFTRCFHDEYGYPPGQAARIVEEGDYTDNTRVQRTDPGTRKRKLVIFLISAISVIIVACIIFIIVQQSYISSKYHEKSIAVLPFINDSPDNSEMYFIDGTMEAILDKLCKIKDLRVIPRTTVLQYREHPEPASEIARKLKVSYILEGSGQKYGDSIRLTLQLIDADHEEHIWSQTYDRDISKIENLFSLQSEIALQVAEKIEATVTPEEKQRIEKTLTKSLSEYTFLTPEEKQRIEKIPTKSPTAYDFLQRASDEHFKYWNSFDQKALSRAKELYRKALEYDSTLWNAWAGLAFAYFDEHLMDSYLSEDFMDSALILANISLSYDDQSWGGYEMRGMYDYFTSGGQINKALKEFEKAKEIAPDSWGLNRAIGFLYEYHDILKEIEYLQKSASLNPRLHLPRILIELGWAYLWTGFPEEAEQYCREAFLLDDDTVTYYVNLAEMEYWLDNQEKVIELGNEVYKIDSNEQRMQDLLAACYRSMGQYAESYMYYHKTIEKYGLENLRWDYPLHYVGHVYNVCGYKEQGNKFFDEYLKRVNRAIELGRPPDFPMYLGAASVYSFLGQKDKAYEYLRIYNRKRESASLTSLTFYKKDPLFDNIRDEPEFQRLLRKYEAKYEAGHESVRKWLDEQDRHGSFNK